METAKKLIELSKNFSNKISDYTSAAIIRHEPPNNWGEDRLMSVTLIKKGKDWVIVDTAVSKDFKSDWDNFIKLHLNKKIFAKVPDPKKTLILVNRDEDLLNNLKNQDIKFYDFCSYLPNHLRKEYEDTMLHVGEPNKPQLGTVKNMNIDVSYFYRAFN